MHTLCIYKISGQSRRLFFALNLFNSCIHNLAKREVIQKRHNPFNLLYGALYLTEMYMCSSPLRTGLNDMKILLWKKPTGYTNALKFFPFLPNPNPYPTAVVRALASHQCGPGSIPGPGVICGLSLLLVLVLAPIGFFSGFSGFPLSSKTNISKFQFNPEPEGHRFVSPRLLGVTLVKQS